MFVRKKVNKSGSVSIQIISKSYGRYKVYKTIGSSSDPKKISALVKQAKFELLNSKQQHQLFLSEQDTTIEGFLSTLNNSNIRVIGPEIVFGKIYDHLGYKIIQEPLFRHLVISRLSYPGSKLKTIDYINRYEGIILSVDSIYRFMDKLKGKLKEQIEQITFKNTLKTLGGKIGIVFYDMTTLHFETSDEDDLRKIGFSKVGKHQNPQIYLGILVGAGGYPIGYKIFEGNISEGQTLIPVLQTFQKNFRLVKPIVIADSGLLSTKNITELKANKYEYILGARIKNESNKIKQQILSMKLLEGQFGEIKKTDDVRLIINYSHKRSMKDSFNRQRGLKRLEKELRSGKLTKRHLNQKGYNKYLKMDGTINIQIDYEKFNQDKKWDGLKGYITNSKLKPTEVIENYNNLWVIEKAFRISKTDLKIRPIYHRIRDRIEAHICIAFTSYAIYKELERILTKEKSNISPARASELTHNMYELFIIMPDTNESKRILLKMSPEQSHLIKIITKNF